MADEIVINMEGRMPTPVKLVWNAVTVQLQDGGQQHFVVLQVSTYSADSVFFLEKNVAMKVGQGILQYASAIPDEGPQGLIVPEVDMNEVLKNLNPNGDNGGS